MSQKREPTIRQKEAFKKTLENGGNVTKGMRDAGYSESTSQHPGQNLTSKQAWKDLLDKYLPDKALMRVHKHLLNTQCLKTKQVPNSWTDKKIKSLFRKSGFKLLEIVNSKRTYVKDGKKRTMTMKTCYYTTADARARNKALEQAYKLKGVNAPEQKVITRRRLNIAKLFDAANNPDQKNDEQITEG